MYVCKCVCVYISVHGYTDIDIHTISKILSTSIILDFVLSTQHSPPLSKVPSAP